MLHGGAFGEERCCELPETGKSIGCSERGVVIERSPCQHQEVARWSFDPPRQCHRYASWRGRQQSRSALHRGFEVGFTAHLNWKFNPFDHHDMASRCFASSTRRNRCSLPVAVNGTSRASMNTTCLGTL